MSLNDYGMAEKYPCPCCGYKVHIWPPGYHQVCPICLWEDDLAQLRFVDMPGSSNQVSLIRGQENFIDIGSAEKRKAAQARSPYPGELRDDHWRVVNPEVDNIEQPHAGEDYATSYPQDATVLYYWRETYWRRLAS